MVPFSAVLGEERRECPKAAQVDSNPDVYCYGHCRVFSLPPRARGLGLAVYLRALDTRMTCVRQVPRKAVKALIVANAAWPVPQCF
jgi:hypothetical protein